MGLFGPKMGKNREFLRLQVHFLTEDKSTDHSLMLLANEMPPLTFIGSRDVNDAQHLSSSTYDPVSESHCGWKILARLVRWLHRTKRAMYRRTSFPSALFHLRGLRAERALPPKQ